jgi:hypothetical protein
MQKTLEIRELMIKDYSRQNQELKEKLKIQEKIVKRYREEHRGMNLVEDECLSEILAGG